MKYNTVTDAFELTKEEQDRFSERVQAYLHDHPDAEYKGMSVSSEKKRYCSLSPKYQISGKMYRSEEILFKIKQVSEEDPEGSIRIINPESIETAFFDTIMLSLSDKDNVVVSKGDERSMKRIEHLLREHKIHCKVQIH